MKRGNAIKLRRVAVIKAEHVLRLAAVKYGWRHWRTRSSDNSESAYVTFRRHGKTCCFRVSLHGLAKHRAGWLHVNPDRFKSVKQAVRRLRAPAMRRRVERERATEARALAAVGG